MEECVINGITYVPVDIPAGDCRKYSCRDCDIFKARPPRTMINQPLCCDREYSKVNKSCCSQQRKGFNRIWKVKSVS